VKRAVTLGLCLLTVLMAASPIDAQGPAIELTVVKAGDNTPIPGARVRVVDASNQEIAKGITDGFGKFVARPVPANQPVTFYYRYDGFVKDPDHVIARAGQGVTRVTGPLYKLGGGDGYLVKVAAWILGTIGTQDTPDTKLRYQVEWDRVLQLTQPEQAIVGKQIQGAAGRFLLADPSFARAIQYGTGSAPAANAR
jgi:hypothetical protein